MTARLRTTIFDMQATAERVNQAIEKIAATTVQQVQGATEQAAAAGQVTVAVEELNQTAGMIAEAAASVADASEQALTSAAHGTRRSTQIDPGHGPDPRAGQRHRRPHSSPLRASQGIGEIINVIDERTAQLHILALNAAIESAGAGGEIGERFGIIASQVRKLAQQSAASAQAVRTVIAEVQAAANAAVMTTEDGLKETEKGVGLARQAGNANADIIQVVERTVQLAYHINLATQQQRSASTQVVATMHQMAQVTQMAAAGHQQTLAAMRELEAISHGMEERTRRFLLGPARPLEQDQPPLGAPHDDLPPTLEWGEPVTVSVRPAAGPAPPILWR